jgi:hypothetical protein
LVEKFKVGNIIYDVDGRELSKMSYEGSGKANLDGLFEVCMEV